MEGNNSILLIDEVFSPLITEEMAEALQPIVRKFLQSYAENKSKMSVETWLPLELQDALPDHTAEEITQISEDILETLKTNEKNSAELEQVVQQGRSKESWFAQKAQQAMSGMGAQAASEYLQSLDIALENANNALTGTFLTKAGTVSQNPHLDGFIAEQYHAQTFNLNAEATGSLYRAKVLQPEGTYAKNSVDIVICDDAGKIVRRYQSKYCKDAEQTQKAFDAGDYRGQRKLVPSDQVDEIVKATDVISSPDGVTSTPLTKPDAKQLQKEAQSGQWNDLNWSEYHTKDLAIGVGKQAGKAALMGAAIGVGFDVAKKVWNGEKIDGEEIIETALVSGADFGVKAAAAGALKVGAERGIIKCIPKGTPAGTLANVAFVAVENIKVLGAVAAGELTVREGMEKMEQTTVSTVAGIATGAKGTAIGATIGTVFGPIGTAIGGFVGGTVGYMAGSKIGETIIRGVQKVRKKAVEVAKNVVRGIANTAKSVARHIPIVKWFV